VVPIYNEENLAPLKHGQKFRYKYATKTFSIAVCLCMTWEQQISEEIFSLYRSKLELIEKIRGITHLLPKSFLTELAEFEKRVDHLCISFLDDKSIFKK